MRRDGRAYSLRPIQCPICGKIFSPAPYHVYEDNEKLFCTWTCYLRFMETKQRKVIKAKPVEQYTPRGVYVKTFSSAKEAALEVGIKRENNIRECCQGKCRTSGGYIWKYKTKEASSDPVESLG